MTHLGRRFREGRARPATELVVGASLTIERGGASAWLRVLPDGRAELEMRDELNHWVRSPCGELEVAPGSSWWFVGGVLPHGGATVEVVASGHSREADTHGGLWLTAIPRVEAIGPTTATAVGPDGQSLGQFDLTPDQLDPTPSVPRPDLGPEHAPVTLRATTTRRLKAAFRGLVLGNAGLGQAFLPGRDLHLDRDGLTFRPLLVKRHYRWHDIGAFVPDRDGTMIGLFLCVARDEASKRSARRKGAHAEVHGRLYDLAPQALAALLMAWRNHYWSDPDGSPRSLPSNLFCR